jgi:hypothetical protein
MSPLSLYRYRLLASAFFIQRTKILCLAVAVKCSLGTTASERTEAMQNPIHPVLVRYSFPARCETARNLACVRQTDPFSVLDASPLSHAVVSLGGPWKGPGEVGGMISVEYLAMV